MIHLVIETGKTAVLWLLVVYAIMGFRALSRLDSRLALLTDAVSTHNTEQPKGN